ncbi:MAG: hypothetical protein OXF08_10690 [Bacteroidetes bacterium]|nr:hypothetical protein [Bacteroidota bacterium]
MDDQQQTIPEIPHGNQSPLSKEINPKAFLQSRRPERFSDSTFLEERKIDRSLLEYHLDSLTSRGQERDFERFARKLAEREICPNLLPQTGPIGGGDSKVDSETYPVAEQLALIWYIGKDIKSSHERWGFAFSASKEWKAKAKGDIAKIASTGRGYVKVFFVTNQYVSDRKRAEFEDQHTKKYQFDVRLLDLNWILEKVFSGNHVDLVDDELQLRIQGRKVTRKGPLDTQRENELEEIEKRIKSTTQNEQFNSALVDDALNSAELARSLDLPRHKVEGRFERAERIAHKYGTQRQRVEVAYQKAWTTFWWYEDGAIFPDLYLKVEERAKGSRNAYDIERLVTLWYLLESCINQDYYPDQPNWLDNRTTTVKGELQRLSREKTRPSTALQAKMSLLTIQVREMQEAGEPLGRIPKEMEKLIEEASNLTGFPLELTVQVITHLGAEPEYDDLFQTATRLSSNQKKELTTGRLFVQRGLQFLKSDQPKHAIGILGLSLRLLFNHTGSYEAVRALRLCAIAYQEIGLLWAARGNLIAAASLSTDDFWMYGKVTQHQSSCYGILKWIELRLGRIPHALSWHATDAATTSALVSHGEVPANQNTPEKHFDALLGILLLRTIFSDLKWLRRLPDGLVNLNLVHASLALLYALGHDDIVTDRFDCSKSDCEKYYTKLNNQPVASKLPNSPSLWVQDRVTLSSFVLGCEFRVDADNAHPFVEIAESLLAAIEALLATIPISVAFSPVPEFPIKVRTSDSAERPFSVNIKEVDGRPHAEIRARPFHPHQMTPDEQESIRTAMQNAVMQIIAHALRVDNFETMFSQLSKEGAFDRAFNFTCSFVALGNVLGDNPPQSLKDWEDGSSYPLRRTKQWTSKISQSERPMKRSDSSLGTIKHTELRTVSIIREGLWDQAKWYAMLFIRTDDDSEPPILAPCFQDATAGRKIFEKLQSDIGVGDTSNKLRVSIIRGINSSLPHAYKVLFGTNAHHPRYNNEEIPYIATVYRFHTMNPKDSFNLNEFIENYKQHQVCIVAPGFKKSDDSCQVDLQFRIVKREIGIRNAWEIGRNDPDASAITSDDDPIIPPEKHHPPVRELLKYHQKQE